MLIMAESPIQLPVGQCPCDDDDIKEFIDTTLWPAYMKYGAGWMNQAFHFNANNKRDIGFGSKQFVMSHKNYFITAAKENEARVPNARLRAREHR